MSKIIRNPQIVWRVEKKKEAEVGAALEAGLLADEQGTVILIVSGTMHQLNYVGGRIWQLCDGEHDVDSIATALAGEFDIDRSELLEDVASFVTDLVSRGWLNND